MANLKSFSVESVPDTINNEHFLECINNSPLIMQHNFHSGITFLITESENVEQTLSSIGVVLKEVPGNNIVGKDFLYFQLIAKDEPRKYGMEEEKPEDFLFYKIFNHDINFFTFFMPADQSYAKAIKEEIEDKISKIEVRSTRGIASGIISNRDSVHNDLYYKSDRKKLLSTILENVNDTIFSRGASYSIGIAIEKTPKSKELVMHLKSKATVLSEHEIRAKSISDLLFSVKTTKGIPIPYKNAAKFVWFSNRIAKSRPLLTSKPRSSGQISIGNYLDSGINETGESISMEKCIFNLGTLITGVPGTGKTMAAKHILSQFAGLEKSSTVIISPTSEWGSFAQKFGIRRIDLADSSIRINFFKCEGKFVQKFYEDLAMLIASASNAGPYTNSIEKCLLAAFMKVYSRSLDPDPQDVYTEIEEAIIEQHAKRTGTSVKYTKHGENIKSSLENIRLILMNPQFAYSGGLIFRSIVKSGAVFDLSNISNNMKSLFYAFILNQIYSVVEEYDIYGDNETRSLICLEEAQLIFGGEEDSAATNDLKQRIQNFRKKGIGLMLITHNVTDINPSIRRLCQIKIYFRQSPDIAKFAANDMVFEEEDYQKAATVFKVLAQKVCALNYIELINGEKVPAGSMFAKIPRLEEELSNTRSKISVFKRKETNISIIQTAPQKEFPIELHFMGENIFNGLISNTICIPNLLENKRYRLVLKGERKRDDKIYTIIGCRENEITLISSASDRS